MRHHRPGIWFSSCSSAHTKSVSAKFHLDRFRSSHVIISYMLGAFEPKEGHGGEGPATLTTRNRTSKYDFPVTVLFKPTVDPNCENTFPGDKISLSPGAKLASAGPEHAAKGPFSYQLLTPLTKALRTSIRPCNRLGSPSQDGIHRSCSEYPAWCLQPSGCRW